jgi:hypothetical protein
VIFNSVAIPLADNVKVPEPLLIDVPVPACITVSVSEPVFSTSIVAVVFPLVTNKIVVPMANGISELEGIISDWDPLRVR